MMTMNFLEQYHEQVNDHLETLIPDNEAPFSSLYQAARYSLLGGGKRLRPILTLTVAKALGGSIEHALTPACCLEMVHAYSLIHDDLPCMDNDDERRGKPTLHRVYPEGHAVLAGDYLLTLAFEKLATADFLTPEQRIELIACLSRDAGADGMIGGQVMDIEAESRTVDVEALKQIHLRKTGALIRASLLFGAIVANASTEEKEVISNVGTQLGLAFQVIDDVLDVTAGEAKHGKSGGSDAVNGKVTYATLFGVESAKTQAKELLDSALVQIQSLAYDTSHLQQLATALVYRSV